MKSARILSPPAKSSSVLILFFSVILLGLVVRLFRLTAIPPGLHGDELGAGYNAYSLLKTGRDEYGQFLPLTFRNDFSPFIFYATIPSVALFGLSHLAVRFPSVLAGTLMLPLSYLLTIQLGKSRNLALLAMFLVALSSWHIRSSRLGLEMIWALFFQIAALVCFLRGVASFPRWFLPSFIFFSLSMFSYQSAKMTSPFLIMALLVIYWDKIKLSKKFIAILFTIFVVSPIALYFLVRPFLDWRFVGISVVTIWKNSYPKDMNLIGVKPLTSLGTMIIGNYGKLIDPGILFFDNRSLRYYQISDVGLFYIWQIPFILLGFVSIWRRRSEPLNKIILFWLFISPIPAALTTGVPNANIGRNLMMFPMVEFICAQGIILVKNLVKYKFLPLAFILVSIASILSGRFFYQYFLVMPKNYREFWGRPYQEAATFLRNKEKETERILITNANIQSYMYFLFYGKVDPTWLLDQPKKRASIVGYSEIGTYSFRPVTIDDDGKMPHTIIVGTADEIPEKTPNIVKEVPGNQSRPAFLRIVQTDNKISL